MLMIPAIDLKDGKCVRLKQGRMDDDTVFGDDPVGSCIKNSHACTCWLDRQQIPADLDLNDLAERIERCNVERDGVAVAFDADDLGLDS